MMITSKISTAMPIQSIFLFLLPAVAGWLAGPAGVTGVDPPAGAGEAAGGSGAGCGGSVVVGGWG